MLPDILQVGNHAHPEIRSVSIVQVLEVFAGEITAFIAVSHLIGKQQLASLLQESTLLIPWSAAGTIRHSDSLALQTMHLALPYLLLDSVII